MIIDFSAHIIPGLDMTCKSRIETIRKLLAAKEAGVDLIVSTPVYDPDECSVEEFIEQRNAAEIILKSLENNEVPEVISAAMVKYRDSLLHTECLEKLCFSGKNFMLSLKDIQWDENTEAVLRHLTEKLGFNVVLTDATELIYKYSEQMQQLGIHVLAEFREVHHKKQIRSLGPYIENGLIIALGSGDNSDSPYKGLDKTIRRMDTAFDALMLSAKELLEIR